MTTATDLSKKQLVTILSALDDAPRSPANKGEAQPLRYQASLLVVRPAPARLPLQDLDPRPHPPATRGPVSQPVARPAVAAILASFILSCKAAFTGRYVVLAAAE